MNDKKDNCINCNALITYDTSTWGYCKKCDHVVDDAIKMHDKKNNYYLAPTLKSKDIDKLKELISIIVNNLLCDINGNFPCLTCRIESLDAMKQFIKIHG